MADNRKRKAGARTGNKTKPVEAEPGGGALQRAAKAREKASAREKKVPGNVEKASSQLDAALLALEKADVGSPKSREIEAAAGAALKALLVQRKKLRKARKALRRAEAKERKVRDRAAATAAKKTRAKERAQTRRASKRRPAKRKKRGSAEARAKSAATQPSVRDTLPATEAVSGVDAGGLRDSAGASRASAPRRELE